MRFEPFHFQPEFDVEVDPAFPGDGTWGHQVVGFASDGRTMVGFDSRWATPLTLLVRPADGASWVGMFATGDVGRPGRGVAAGPGPDQLVVWADGLVFVGDVRRPDQIAVVTEQCNQMAAVAGLPILLLALDSELVALGPAGPLWQSPRLVLDQLRVDGADVDGIVWSGDAFPDGTASLVLDPLTGAQVAGPRFEDSWPPGAR